VWFVFGVQSSAKRTVPSGVTDADGAALADATADGDAPAAAPGAAAADAFGAWLAA
jgi:hypothetical protein